jgi:hypothetical protein
VQLEINPDAGARDVLYDEGSKTVRIPLAALADTARRSKMVMFRCNKCGEWSAWRHGAWPFHALRVVSACAREGF